MKHIWNPSFNIRGNMNDKIPWELLVADGDYLFIDCRKDGFGNTLRTSAWRYAKDRDFKIQVECLSPGVYRCIRSCEKRDLRVSKYRVMFELKVGETVFFPWTWQGLGGGDPPEYRQMRAFFLKALALGLNLYWHVPNGCKGVEITRLADKPKVP